MTSAAPAPALSFPPQTFQKLSPSSYLLRHLQSTPPTRPSGRSPSAFREPTVHTNSLSHAHGSAVVRTGDTAVVCGVRAEILSLKHGDGKAQGRVTVLRSSEDDEELVNEEEDGSEGELRARNLIVTNLELGTGCSRDYHPGPPSDFAQTTTSRLHRLLLSTASLISPASLRITDNSSAEPEIKAYWVLYIDILCISLDGNILDTAWASIIAALRSTRLPRAFWDVDAEAVRCDPEQHSGLQLGPLAFTATFAVVNGGEGGEGGEKVVVLSDPDEFEESVCEEIVMVCIKEGGRIARIEKGGGLVCGMEGLGECVGRARERFDVWEKVIRGAVL